MPDSPQATARVFRYALLSHDAETLARVTEAYGLVRDTLRRELSTLLARIEQERAAGTAITRGWLAREDRLRGLLTQTQGALDSFGRDAALRITAAQSGAAALAQEAAREVAASVTGTWNRLPQAALQSLVGVMGDGSPVGEYLRRVAGDGFQKVKAALIEGVALGRSPRRVAVDVEAAAGVTRSRALTIARTETFRAYRDASLQTYRENSDVVGKWRWLASLSGGTCPVCISMHGSLHDLDEPFGSHVNCCLPGTIVETPPIKGSTVRRYVGDVIQIGIENGNVLTVTPNHPILTPEGYVGAGTLVKGGYVIRALDAKRILSLVNPDYDDVPTAIEDIAEPFRGANGVVSVTVPTATEDFHGDGGGSDVCVVASYGFLGNDAGNTPFGKQLRHNRFIWRRMGTPLFARSRPLRFFFDCANAPAGCSMGFDGVSGVLFGRSRSVTDSVGVGLVAARGTGFAQASGDNVSAYAERLCDSIFAIPVFVPRRYFRNREIDFTGWVGNHSRGVYSKDRGTVTEQIAFTQSVLQSLVTRSVIARRDFDAMTGNVITDRVLYVKRRGWCGQVYNLQTETGWYIANGIISHNCRCVPSPVSEGRLAAPFESGEAWLTRQAEDVQDRVFRNQGTEAAAAWRRGDVRLADFVKTADDPKWGLTRTSIKPRSLTRGG